MGGHVDIRRLYVDVLKGQNHPFPIFLLIPKDTATI